MGRKHAQVEKERVQAEIGGVPGLRTIGSLTLHWPGFVSRTACLTSE